MFHEIIFVQVKRECDVLNIGARIPLKMRDVPAEVGMVCHFTHFL